MYSQSDCDVIEILNKKIWFRCHFLVKTTDVNIKFILIKYLLFDIQIYFRFFKYLFMKHKNEK